MKPTPSVHNNTTPHYHNETTATILHPPMQPLLTNTENKTTSRVSIGDSRAPWPLPTATNSHNTSERPPSPTKISHQYNCHNHTIKPLLTITRICFVCQCYMCESVVHGSFLAPTYWGPLKGLCSQGIMNLIYFIFHNIT